MTRDLLLAVDVGTASARAGIVDRSGAMLARTDSPFPVDTSHPGHVEIRSEDIWQAVCRAVQAVRFEAGAAPERIAAIAFDATCSLVVRGAGGESLCVSETGNTGNDTIAWIDHRALAEAEACTATGHPVLASVGGVMHPEMQVPKLLWLKRHRPDTWRAMGLAFDLADFLAWKACGSRERSQCTLTAKWTYQAHDGGWRDDFFAEIGLADLRERCGLPDHVRPVGATLGRLLPTAAEDLGLDEDCVVGTGMIDAFAGALGLLGGCDEIEHRMALIAGTSNCLMGFSRTARPTPYVWGPYWEASLPGFWVTEGGSSAAGALLDHVIRLFGNGLEPDAPTHKRIAARIFELREQCGDDLGDGIDILPDLHGNRSPFADPRASGVFSGVTLDTSFDGLCRVYWRALVAMALAVRHVAEHFTAFGHTFDKLHLAGGHARNPLIVELYADATGYPVIETGPVDAVLVGTAAAAAVAAGWFPDLTGACRAMRPEGRLCLPNPARFARFEKDYRVFLKMYEHKRELEAMR